MFRDQLPRWYELWDLVDDPTSPNAYVFGLEEQLRNSLQVREFYVRLEAAFGGVDEENWQVLKRKAGQYVMKKDKNGRGWQQMFDVLREAHGFNFLKGIGCSTIRFIPERQGVRTPDLWGRRNDGQALCEVKSINISDAELRGRNQFNVARSMDVSLSEGFLSKLGLVIAQAKDQMNAYDPLRESEHYIYINIDFDDILAQCKERYFREIDEFLSDTIRAGVNILVRNDHTAFYKRLAMVNAIVDNAG